MKKKEVKAPEMEQTVYVNSKIVSDLTALINKYGNKKIQTGGAILVDRLNKMEYGDFVVICKRVESGEEADDKVRGQK